MSQLDLAYDTVTAIAAPISDRGVGHDDANELEHHFGQDSQNESMNFWRAVADLGKRHTAKMIIQKQFS